MSMPNDIAAALVLTGTGQATSTGSDWFIYKGRFQDGDPSASPVIADRAICIYESPGLPPEEGLALDYPDFQVAVRSEPDGYEAASAKAHDIFIALHANEVAINAGVSPPSAAFVYCYAKNSGPIPLGFDEKRRALLARNFRTLKGRS